MKRTFLNLIALFLASAPIMVCAQSKYSPVQVGGLSCNSSYMDLRSNASSMGYGNNLNSGNSNTGQLSDDVWYMFTVPYSLQLTVSTCGSGFDTYLHLLNGSYGEIAYNDDDYAVHCGGNSVESYLSATLSPGTYYIVAEGYSSNSGTIHLNITGSASSGGSPCSPGNLNFVRAFTPRQAIADVATLQSLSGDVNMVSTATTYFDGLGRPMQSVQRQASPGGKDLVVPITYDQYGRENKKYLSYADVGAANGEYKVNATAAVDAFYATGNNGIPIIPNPYAETAFEPSPLGRATEQGAPGTAWQLGNGHTVTSSYNVNSVGEVKRWLWNGNSAGATWNSAYYTAGTLYKTQIKDENGNYTVAYKDRLDRMICKRAIGESDLLLDTYYIYDDYGNLAYVVPPIPSASYPTSFTELGSDAAFSGYIYAYHYDGRNRMIEKKLPGKGWEEVIYNPLDQVVFTQDAVQRGGAIRSFIKYDALGRTVMTGVEIGHHGTRAEVQGTVNTLVPYWETRDNTAANYHGYNNLSCPSFVPNLQPDVVNYYDDYNIPGIPENLSASYSGMTRGLLTASKVKVLGSSNQWLWTVNYYDNDGRLLRIRSDNHLNGGTDVVVNSYSFVGELTASTRTHTANGTATVIAERFGYDHAGRQTTIHHKIGNAGSTEVLMSQKYYNEVGQLREKSYHNGLRTTGYFYNERGWLKKTSTPGFEMELKYNDGTVPQFNGNISGQYWGVPGNLDKNYAYSYDALNRLRSGISSTGHHEKDITYDEMGNLLTLTRNSGTPQVYDYANTGNRLNTVTGGASRSYTYDANGNAVGDGTNTFAYNHLNLIASVGGPNAATYTYDANGRKLGRVAGGVTTDYVDGIQYVGGTIDFVQTEEGIARRSTATSYVYEYALKDHLGNSRYSFDQNGTKVQSDDYYPFGKTYNSFVNGARNNYLYNGKELQDGLGQYDYGARFYDPVIGRWNGVDPLAEDFNSVSPYNYGMNNPISMIDPDGMSTEDWKKEHGINDSDLVNVYKAPSENEEEQDPEKQEIQNGRIISNTPGQGLRRNGDGSFDSYSTPNNHKCGGFCTLDHKGGEQFVDNVMDVATLFFPIKIKGFKYSKYGFSLFKFGIAGKYGFKSYKVLKALTKGLSVEVHHLIEKRFAGILGEKAAEMTSIVLTKTEHQALTNAWRKEIGYITDNTILRTNNVTKVQIENAARKIYANYPEILQRLGL
ncbi:DUF6443 domain-containing protein [Pedobacter sp. WC2501]|uniref:DUF6443 domain-containing protein n=1 Tax=Pedobacter sp. WC2501 TaxID=3461400 RepID=UPI004045C843